jgi:hypothetical protein
MVGPATDAEPDCHVQSFAQKLVLVFIGRDPQIDFWMRLAKSTQTGNQPAKGKDRVHPDRQDFRAYENQFGRKIAVVRCAVDLASIGSKQTYSVPAQTVQRCRFHGDCQKRLLVQSQSKPTLSAHSPSVSINANGPTAASIMVVFTTVQH